MDYRIAAAALFFFVLGLVLGFLLGLVVWKEQSNQRRKYE